MTSDARRFSPAIARNRDHILGVLGRHLPSQGIVLEVASGSGEHVVYFAGACGADLVFQPSDPDPIARASIDAWIKASGVRNVRPSIALDAVAAVWPLARADAVICINMVHIAPWSAAEGLMRGAARVLDCGELLFLYGPFRRDGRHTSASNQAFDEELKLQNPAWGVRDLEAVEELAAANGFVVGEVVEMPANNLSVVMRLNEFRK